MLTFLSKLYYNYRVRSAAGRQQKLFTRKLTQSEVRMLPLKAVSKTQEVIAKPKIKRVRSKNPLKYLTKKQLRIGSSWGLALIALLAVVAWDGQRGRSELVSRVDYNDAKHDHNFVEPVVKRILAANVHNKQLAENTGLLRSIVRYAADACFRTNCDTELLLAVFRVESNYQPGIKNKVSSATGLGQTLALWQNKLVAHRLCTMPPQVSGEYAQIEKEVEDAAHVLTYYKARARGDKARMLNGYYGGDSRVWQPDAETRDYTQRTLYHYRELSV